eukprot:848281_1
MYSDCLLLACCSICRTRVQVYNLFKTFAAFVSGIKASASTAFEFIPHINRFFKSEKKRHKYWAHFRNTSTLAWMTKHKFKITSSMMPYLEAHNQLNLYAQMAEGNKCKKVVKQAKIGMDEPPTKKRKLNDDSNKENWINDDSTSTLELGRTRQQQRELDRVLPMNASLEHIQALVSVLDNALVVCVGAELLFDLSCVILRTAGGRVKTFNEPNQSFKDISKQLGAISNAIPNCKPRRRRRTKPKNSNGTNPVTPIRPRKNIEDTHPSTQWRRLKNQKELEAQVIGESTTAQAIKMRSQNDEYYSMVLQLERVQQMNAKNQLLKQMEKKNSLENIYKEAFIMVEIEEISMRKNDQARVLRESDYNYKYVPEIELFIRGRARKISESTQIQSKDMHLAMKYQRSLNVYTEKEHYYSLEDEKGVAFSHYYTFRDIISTAILRLTSHPSTFNTHSLFHVSELQRFIQSLIDPDIIHKTKYIVPQQTPDSECIQKDSEDGNVYIQTDILIKRAHDTKGGTDYCPQGEQVTTETLSLMVMKPGAAQSLDFNQLASLMNRKDSHASYLEFNRFRDKEAIDCNSVYVKLAEIDSERSLYYDISLSYFSVLDLAALDAVLNGIKGRNYLTIVVEKGRGSQAVLGIEEYNGDRVIFENPVNRRRFEKTPWVTEWELQNMDDQDVPDTYVVNVTKDYRKHVDHCWEERVKEYKSSKKYANEEDEMLAIAVAIHNMLTAQKCTRMPPFLNRSAFDLYKGTPMDMLQTISTLPIDGTSCCMIWIQSDKDKPIQFI